MSKLKGWVKCRFCGRPIHLVTGRGWIDMDGGSDCTATDRSHKPV